MVDKLDVPVVPTQSVETAMVVHHQQSNRTLIQKWVGENLPQRGAELGVSIQYLERMVGKHRLSIPQLDELVHVRLDYKAGLASISSLLASGLSVAEIHGLYHAREEFMDAFRDEKNDVSISLQSILRFSRAFPEANLESDHLGEALIEAFTSFRDSSPKKYRRIQGQLVSYHHVYPDEAIKFAAELSEKLGLATLDVVLDLIEQPAEHETVFGQLPSGLYQSLLVQEYE